MKIETEYVYVHVSRWDAYQEGSLIVCIDVLVWVALSGATKS